MRVYIKVIPKSSREKLEKVSDGNYKVWLNAPAEKGKANERLVDFLAEHFGISKKNIIIVSGKTSRIKLVELGI